MDTIQTIVIKEFHLVAFTLFALIAFVVAMVTVIKATGNVSLAFERSLVAFVEKFSESPQAINQAENRFNELNEKYRLMAQQMVTIADTLVKLTPTTADDAVVNLAKEITDGVPFQTLVDTFVTEDNSETTITANAEKKATETAAG